MDNFDIFGTLNLRNVHMRAHVHLLTSHILGNSFYTNYYLPKKR